MEAIPQVESEAIRRALLNEVRDGFSLLSEQLSQVKASLTLDINILVLLLEEEGRASFQVSCLVVKIDSSLNEQSSFRESKVQVHFRKFFYHYFQKIGIV